MKIKKILIAVITILTIFVIYTFFKNDKITYVALGDSLSAGQNPYGEIKIGYTDLLANYLNSKDKLKFFTKEYSKSGYETSDILNDLENNKKIIIDNKEYNIRKLLRETDLITISIGANDLINDLNITTILSTITDTKNLYQEIDNIFIKIKNVITEVEKYAKGQILVIGYYNPFPNQKIISQEKMDLIFAHVDEKFEDICTSPNTNYISIYQKFKENPNYLPNTKDIHPNTEGYEAIKKEITNFIEKNTKLVEK